MSLEHDYITLEQAAARHETPDIRTRADALEALCEQNLHLKRLLQEGLDLLPERPTVYTNTLSNPAWHKDVAVRKAWRERVLAVLATERKGTH